MWMWIRFARKLQGGDKQFGLVQQKRLSNWAFFFSIKYRWRCNVPIYEMSLTKNCVIKQPVQIVELSKLFTENCMIFTVNIIVRLNGPLNNFNVIIQWKVKTYIRSGWKENIDLVRKGIVAEPNMSVSGELNETTWKLKDIWFQKNKVSAQIRELLYWPSYVKNDDVN